MRFQWCCLRILMLVKAQFFGKRHLQYGILLIGTILAYGMRTSFNVAIIAMISDDPPNENVPTYPEWTSKKNIMLSSFFWGYICFQVGAGQLAKNYGPKLFLGAAICLSSIFTLLIPIVGAHFGYAGVIVCRIVQGMTQGFLYPSIHNLLSAWTPICDRAKYGGLIYAGSPLGTLIAMPLTGLICASTVGWTVVFYLYGSLGVAWSLIWMWIGSDSPSVHKSISAEEKRYIEEGLPTDDKETVPTPWKAIFTSLPFWAILVAHSGQNWGFWTLITEIPSFMQEILGFKIDSNSYLSAIPYLVQWIISLFMGPTADWLITKRILSTGACRKLFNSIGLFIPAIALLCMNFVGGNQKELTIVILVIAVGFNAGVYNGYTVNHIDISPIHAGTLMGLTNSLANIFSIIAPLAVDAIIFISGYKETDKSLWNIVFSLSAAVYIVTEIFYIFAGSGEVQPWDNLEANKEIETKDESELGTDRGKLYSREVNALEKDNDDLNISKGS